jgi:sulfatase maturation enzyme AslB (radical SAM superfamily)
MTEKEKSPFANFKWNERTPVFVKKEDLRADQWQRVVESDNFCMIPWIHLHGWPTGEAYPCCLGEGAHPIGNLKKETIAEIWNGADYREMRRNMMTDQPSKQCVRCYEQEGMGFASMRNNTNRHFAQHIGLVDETHSDGTLETMKFRYWDIRFSNTCNLKCRTCGGIFSSRWYDDETKLNGGRPMRERVLYAGRHQMDIWYQMEDQIQHLEQIYFAGGEPLMMEEHYRILDRLLETGNTSVRLVYNTNLTEFRFKRRSVLDYWNQFPNVCVAASLDGMGDHAEIIRSGTNWAKVEQNCADLVRECPHVDFLISPTLSVMNAWHLPEFHRYMIEQGYIKPMDLNVNILQSPEEYRIDIIPMAAKEELSRIYEEHAKWLDPQDSLKRASGGFRSAIQFMNAKDNSHLVPKFWETASKLDRIRNEYIVDTIPELRKLNV